MSLMAPTGRPLGRKAGPLWGRRRRRRWQAGITYVLILAGLLWVIVPLAWMLSSALKDNVDIFRFPPDLIPAHPAWGNFVAGFTAIPFLRYLGNSLLIAVPATLGTVSSSALAAYAFARLRFPGSRVLFVITLATLMIPSAVTLVPGYLIFSWLGWVGTDLPLIVPSFFGGGAFNIFLLRQFFRGIPRALDDSARVDGATFLQVFWHIIVPQSIPALSAVGIFDFVSHWNDFFGPLIYLADQDQYTLTVGLASFRDIYGNTQWNLLMADSLLATIPVVAIFFLFQRVFVQGIVVSGIKG